MMAESKILPLKNPIKVLLVKRMEWMIKFACWVLKIA